VFEATNPHVTEAAWNYLLTRARGMNIPHPNCRYPDGKLPDGRLVRDAMKWDEFPLGVDEDGKPLFFNQVLADCNPDAETHWLWRRYEAGHMTRLRSLHVDNPMIKADYLEQLRSLPGVYYDRLFLGKWVAAARAIWGTYNDRRHCVATEWHMEPLTGRRFITVPDWTDDKGQPAQFAVSGVVAGLDFGYSKPGSLEVLAITPGGRTFVVAEVYAVEKGFEWWAERVTELVDEFKIEVVRTDHDHNGVDIINKRLGPRSGRENGGLCQFANKKRRKTGSGVGDMGGLDVVREAFRSNRLFISKTATRYHDEILAGLHLPMGLRQEIGAYQFDFDEKTGEVFEVPPKNAIDHACDGLRYGYMDVFERTWKNPGEVRFVAPEGVVAYHVGTPEERARLRQLAKKRSSIYRLTYDN
jgi:hypothetical protein